MRPLHTAPPCGLHQPKMPLGGGKRKNELESARPFERSCIEHKMGWESMVIPTTPAMKGIG